MNSSRLGDESAEWIISAHNREIESHQAIDKDPRLKCFPYNLVVPHAVVMTRT